jgi:hypothetical protein
VGGILTIHIPIYIAGGRAVGQNIEFRGFASNETPRKVRLLCNSKILNTYTVKILTSDPLFPAGNISGISEFLKFFTFDPGKRQKNSRLGRLSFLKAEVFPARKILISDIPGFPAGDRDRWLIFLTV